MSKNFEEYRMDCHENGEVPCLDIQHHDWVVSSENENVCTCSKCGCYEY